MNFDLSDEQRMLADTVARFVADRSDRERKRRVQALPGGFDRADWTAMAGLGLTALPFSEAHGGLGGSDVDGMIVHEALGAGLADEPYLAAITMAGRLLAATASDAQRARWLAPLIAGESVIAFAHAERALRYRVDARETVLASSGGGLRLSGAKTFVIAGDAADAAIVLARREGGDDGDAGLALVWVPLAAAGVTRRAYRTVDGHAAAELRFDAVAVPADALLAEGAAARAALDDAIAETALGAAADSLGTMATAFEHTLAYVKQRKQFGVAIGSFQAIQHRMVECRVSVEQARNIVLRAVLTDRADRDAWRRTALGARAYVAEAAQQVAQEAVQFHGGMGMTDELIIGHCLKRILMTQSLFGDGRTHLKRFAALAA